MSNFVVVYDACVLYAAGTRDHRCRAAATGWTAL